MNRNLSLSFINLSNPSKVTKLIPSTPFVGQLIADANRVGPAPSSGMDLAGCFVVIAGAGLPAVAALSPKYNNLLWHCLASSFLVKTHQTTLSKILCRRLLKPPSGTIT